jgi:hypothetical protein
MFYVYSWRSLPELLYFRALMDNYIFTIAVTSMLVNVSRAKYT